MSKRRADRQLTSDDDPEALVSDNGSGTWSKAPDAVLKKRKIIKATRRGVPAATPKPAPATTPEVAAPAPQAPVTTTDTTPKTTEAPKAATGAAEPAKVEIKPWSFGDATPFSFDKPSTETAAAPLNFWGSGKSTFGTTGGGIFGQNIEPPAKGSESKSFNFGTSSSGLGDWVPPASKKVPVIEKPKEPLKSGEEDDTNHHETRGKLYKLVEKEGNMTWAERGKGPLLINQNNKTKLYRFILRNDKSNRLVLNAALYKGLTVTKAAEKLLNLAVVNTADLKKDEPVVEDKKEETTDEAKKEEEAKPASAIPELYALRFASKENADNFKAKIESIVKTLDE